MGTLTAELPDVVLLILAVSPHWKLLEDRPVPGSPRPQLTRSVRSAGSQTRRSPSKERGCACRADAVGASHLAHHDLFTQFLTHTASAASTFLLHPPPRCQTWVQLGKAKQEHPQTASGSWRSDEKTKGISPKSIYSRADIWGGYV